MLGLILARGGSKGIPGKNLVDLGSRPLIQWTIDAAHRSQLTRVVVATDCDEIADLAYAEGCEVLRRAPVSDTASSHEAELDAIARLQCAAFLRLQPTSPFRTWMDINHCISMLGAGAGAVVGFSEVQRHPNLHVTLGQDGSIELRTPENREPRQTFQKAYAVCGAIYGAWSEYFLENDGWWGPNTKGLLIPKERSLDIDDPWDLKIGRAVA